MEKSKVMQAVSRTPPVPSSWKSPASHQLSPTHLVPIVVHFGDRQPDSFRFLFYKASWSNSYSPFYTAQKPTCGYRFHRDTDHTRKVIDVPSANIVKWRPI
ncbi:hypothetical protein N324_08790, partial [Chlamydotis macqueenii]